MYTQHLNLLATPEVPAGLDDVLYHMNSVLCLVADQTAVRRDTFITIGGTQTGAKHCVNITWHGQRYTFVGNSMFRAFEVAYTGLQEILAAESVPEDYAREEAPF